MIYLRNRLADYEVHVAEYYMQRGAFVAAANRAKGEIEQYDGAPATQQALAIMIEAYDRLNLPELAANARKVYQANYPGQVRAETAEVKRHWWKFW
jgi:outer membrane protein assembly factor BamD